MLLGELLCLLEQSVNHLPHVGYGVEGVRVGLVRLGAVVHDQNPRPLV